MTLIGKINRVPQPHNGARGAEARAMYVGLPGDIGELIEGAAGCSPYLHSLLISERDWLCSGIENPESALTIDVPDENIGARLRHAKRRMALITALADLGGAWPLEKVTAALTSFADNAVSVALRNSLSGELRKLPGMEKNDLADACGMIVVAMGKMGAGEMNYSSDIDLVCLHDQSRFADVNHESARLGFIRATRSMVSLLNAKTSEGYVFRTDLRLRPDPAVMRFAFQCRRHWDITRALVATGSVRHTLRREFAQATLMPEKDIWSLCLHLYGAGISITRRWKISATCAC